MKKASQFSSKLFKYFENLSIKNEIDHLHKKKNDFCSFDMRIKVSLQDLKKNKIK